MYNVVSKEPSLWHNGRTIAAFVHSGYFPIYALNRIKSHPIQAQFSRHPESIFLHAEIAAYIKAKKIFSENDFRNSDLYILRILREPANGIIKIGNSKPCKGCMKMIGKVQPSSIFFSNSYGEMERLDVES